MEKLIDTVNRLQEVFSSTRIGDLHTEIQLPQIVVIGAQSAGKSSVLEGIVGKDFLPRGIGIVTRRPLILHLNQCPPDNVLREKLLIAEKEDFAFFGHLPENPFTDFEQVRAEIEADTDRIAGENKGICPEPIILTIHSHRVVKLSLVDLPGITKVPIGDQPLDIEAQIRTMLMKYIENPNSLILAVTAANQDFATSEAIKMAQDVDPEGLRTLAVLTKLDLMDKGVDAMKELTGQVIPIKRGIVGVINRSQADIVANKPIEECWKDETHFLKTNYGRIANENGVRFLANRLHKMLLEHILLCLPKLAERIDQNIEACETDLKHMGQQITDPSSTVVDLLNRFATAYNSTIMGTVQLEELLQLQENDGSLIGGAQISFIFHSLYAKALEGIDPKKTLNIETIYKAVQISNGLTGSIIVPEPCFEQLAKQQITRLEKPSQKCVGQVHEEMKKAIGYCDAQLLHGLQRFPILRAKLFNVVTRLLDDLSKQASGLVRQLIASHEDFINTKHPDFSSERALLKMLANMNNDPSLVIPKKKQNRDSLLLADNDSDSELDENVPHKNGSISKRERENCRLIRSLVSAYFKIVRKSVQDQVPKAIVHTIVKHMQKNLNKELYLQLHKPAELGAWLEEDPELVNKRATLQERLQVLLKAEDALNELGNNYCF